MAKIHSVSVRALAEFATERGSLLPGGASYARMREGVRGHQALQELLPPSWRAEAPISRDIEIDGEILRIHGRADAVYLSGDEVQLMEIKTTRKNPAYILKYDYPAHWAQAEIYACLFCLETGAKRAGVTISYARMDGGRRDFHEDYALDTLMKLLMGYARPFMAWIRTVDDWKEDALPTLKSLAFPYPDYREGQREMARQVFYAMKHGSNALIEAPTGIGKTAASLYGALKALGKGYVTAVFYLTARTTGRRAAEDALDRMRAQGLLIRSVTITAKEKCCLLDKQDCMGCPCALGYYDRRREALKQAMGIQRLDAEAVRALAMDHELCPFELSLDISETADVIICDYNYVFDPRIRLRRYFDAKSKAGLLVDEAHNLADRAREMYSAELSGADLEALRGRVAAFEGKSPMVQLMDELLDALRAEGEAEPEALSELPEAVAQAARRFYLAAGELESAEPEVREFVFDAQWFSTVAAKFDPECYRAMLTPEGKWMSVRLWCFDPSKYLKKAFERVGGAALFSATLAPIGFYAGQLGVDGEADSALQLESPFPRENLAVFRLSVPVSMNERRRTLETVVRVIHALSEAKVGNYLACFPSYAYMTDAFRLYRLLWPDDKAICQESGMSEAKRAAFIARFEMAPRESLTAFVVLGGVFAEGVDLPDDRLSGAAIVSTGIPQLSFERETLRRLIDDADDMGMEAAYTYPGYRRVLQAAGRVIRTETDRGVVVLMDARYRQENYRQLTPPHWDVEDVKKLSQLRDRLKAFWSGTDE